jgi:phage terminase small subunit
MEEDKELTLNDRQRRFCEEYLIDFNATQAAIRSGYSEKTAAEMGYENLRKPHIRAFIDAKLKEMSLSSDETLKSISDIAKGSLNKYLIVKEVVEIPQVKKHLSQIIKDIKVSIEDSDKFIQRANITDQRRLDEHNEVQNKRREEIIKLEIELERNPEASKVVAGEPVLVKVVQLDLVKLTEDKEAGRIKSIKHTEHGLHVEMYSADAALTNLARIHGLFEKDNEQSGTIISTGAKVVRISKKKDE